MSKKRKVSAKQAYDFYKDPKNLKPQSEPVRRRSALTRTLPIRLSPEMLDEVRQLAEKDYRSVGSFVRLAIANELERRRAPRRSRAHG